MRAGVSQSAASVTQTRCESDYKHQQISVITAAYSRIYMEEETGARRWILTLVTDSPSRRIRSFILCRMLGGVSGMTMSNWGLAPSSYKGTRSQLGICSLPLQGDAVNWGFAPFPYKGTKSTGDFLSPTTREHSQSGTDSLPLQGNTVMWRFDLSPFRREHSKIGNCSLPV